MALTKKQLEECEAKHAKKKVAKKPTKAEKEAVAKKAVAKKAVAKKAVAKKKVAKKPTKAQKEAEKAKKADVAKDKGKSTKADIDSKVAKDKKAVKGKLTQTAFLEDITLAKGYDGKNDDFYDDMFGHILDDIGGNANTEAKQQRAFERASNRAYTEIGKYTRRLFNRLIKGKKFKSFKEAQEAFLEDFHYNAYFYEDI